jgi:multisubunit Na+/H+ antiporter MnhE subunit
VIGLLLRAAGLTAVYLLVLTSVHPGDVAVGAVLGLGIAAWLRPRRAGRAAPPPVSPRGVAAMLAQTAAEVVRGSWRTVRFCLGAPAAPGLVEIPRGDRTRVEVGVWGVLTGEAPDEVPVDVDEERDVLVVHLVDASDPDAVRERHRRTHERLRGRPEH